MVDLCQLDSLATVPIVQVATTHTLYARNGKHLWGVLDVSQFEHQLHHHHNRGHVVLGCTSLSTPVSGTQEEDDSI